MTAGRRTPVHAVILAGGAGERFWPASRRHHPKPFLRVVEGRSLLEATLARARRFARRDRIWIVCGREHARAIREASRLAPGHVLVEPARRNTAMAVGWAAVRVAAQDPDAVIAVLSADHHIPDDAAFAAAIEQAAAAASDAGVLVTLGVRPTRPETGYGYIRVGHEAGSDFPGLRLVDRFVEKPDVERARQYLEEGGHLWNAGIFVWSAASLQQEIASCEPELHRALAPLRRRPRGRNRAALESAYRRAPALSIDVAVMERSRRVWTLPVDFAWSDVGTWSSLAEQLGVGIPEEPSASAARGAGGRRERMGKKRGTKHRRGARGDASGNRVLAGDVLFEDSGSNLVWGGKRLVALLGVEDLAVVDTEDVILVTKLDRSPDVRRFVATLKADRHGKLT